MEEKKERIITRVEDGEKAVKKTVKKVEDAVEETVEEVEEKVKKTKPVATLSKAEEKSKATTLRIISVILWVFALAFEVLAILFLFKKLYISWLPQMWAMIICIVLDLICCVIAALLWKKASHLDPFKKTGNKVGFFILTQLGVIMAAICFIPLIILVLLSKDKLDKKSKIIVLVVAIVAFAIAGLLGADFNPISAEEKEQAEQTLTGDVYWTAFGHKYHLDDNCQAIRNSANIYTGSVTAAIDNGRGELCAFCARNAQDAGLDLTGINVEERAVETVEDLAVVPDGE